MTHAGPSNWWLQGQSLTLIPSLIRELNTRLFSAAISGRWRKIATVLLQIILWLGGIGALAWGLVAPQFRDSEGFLGGTFSFPLALGIALVALGVGVAGRMKWFALWSALALLSQASLLQLVDAGPQIHYQHYRPFAFRSDNLYFIFLLILGVQFIAVGIGIASRWTAIRSWMRENHTVWQLLLVGGLIVVSSAAVSPSPEEYAFELIFASLAQAVNVGNLILICWSAPEETLVALVGKVQRLRAFSRSHWFKRITPVEPLVVVCVLWTIIVPAALNLIVYQNHPHVQDEVIYFFQARYLASGSLSVPAPPVPQAFGLYMIPFQESEWYSIFPPGWPLALAIGVSLGVSWLINPVLAGLNILLIYRLVKALYSGTEARLTALLTSVSPWYLFLAMSFMSHVLALSCALLAAYWITQARKRRDVVFALMAGLAVGFLSMVRPQDAVIVGALLVLWGLGFGGRRLSFRALLAFGLGVAALGLLILPYNWLVTGNPLTFPLSDYYARYFGPEANAFGFGPGRGLGWAIDAFRGHSPVEALLNNVLNLFLLNTELFGWSTGSLILVALFLVSGEWRTSDRLMIAVCIAIIGFFSLYWFNGGPDFGARYWFLMLVPLVVLTIRGVQDLGDRLRVAGYEIARLRLLMGISLLAVFSMTSFLPWRAVDKYFHYLGMRPDIRSLVNQKRFEDALVFIRGARHPDYASAWVYNSLDLTSNKPVFVWEANAVLRQRVLAAFPGRQVWTLAGPSTTGAGYELVEDPLPANN